MIDKFLPIGTIVLLKEGKKRLMITGYGCNDNDKMYDYSGCLYPEGIVSLSSTFAFNHDQIKQIYFMGFIDEEEKMFVSNLKSFIANSNIDN